MYFYLITRSLKDNLTMMSEKDIFFWTNVPQKLIL
jgi:hypothetical protein